MIFMFDQMNTWTESDHKKEQYETEIYQKFIYYTGLTTESPCS